jgi:uncharacterized phage-associated protein
VHIVVDLSRLVRRPSSRPAQRPTPEGEVKGVLTIYDVAAYILHRAGGPISTMKLQKLAYYCQAWHATWTRGGQLFPESFQAWANGPVCYDLYLEHRGLFSIDAASLQGGNAARVSGEAKENIDLVLQTYMPLTGAELSYLTHAEAPWLNARRGLPDGVRSQSEIRVDDMVEYYGSLDPEDPDVRPVSEMERPTWA